MTSFLLFVSLIISICRSNDTESSIIICDKASQCQRRTISCTLYFNCSITCSAYESCRSATINCPINQLCNIACTGASSCRNIKINPPIVPSLFNLIWSEIGALANVTYPIYPVVDDKDFELICDSYGLCQEMNIICPTSGDCYISCSAGYSCAYATIKCPINADCDISCSNYDSCLHTNIDCPINGDCSIECDGEDACSSVDIHWSNISTNTGTLICSDDDACSDIEHPPTTPPTAIPTYSPTQTPSISPSISPTFPPTPIPTSFPTDIPSVCHEASHNNISFDGEDQRHNILEEISGTLKPRYYITNESVEYYENIGFNKQIQCGDVEDICYIKCDKIASCGHSLIDVISTDLSQIIIECVGKYSCFGASINITNTNVEAIILICDSLTACGYMEFTIINSTIDTLKVYCNDIDSCKSMHIISKTNVSKISLLCNSMDSCNSLIFDQYITDNDMIDIECIDPESCNSMDIDLYSKYNKKYVYNVSIHCYATNSCHNLLMTAPDDVLIKMVILRYSENVHIVYKKPNDIAFTCGNKKDKLFIRYNVHNPPSEKELLDLGANEFDNKHMPCDGIYIDCTNYHHFTKQCIMKYSVLLQTMQYISTISCYWLEINDIFSISCNGNCDDNIMYYQHNKSIDLDIILDINNNYNDSALFEKCETLFGTVTVTQHTLHDINDIFMDVLRILERNDSFIINDVLRYPDTILIDKFIRCNDGFNVIHINTNINIKTGIANESEFDKLFVDKSLFVNESQKLLSQLFGIFVTLRTMVTFHKNTSSTKYNKFKDLILVAIVCGVGFILLVIIGICVWCFCRGNKDGEHTDKIEQEPLNTELV